MKEFIFSLRVEVLCCVCLYLVFDLEKKKSTFLCPLSRNSWLFLKMFLARLIYCWLYMLCMFANYGQLHWVEMQGLYIYPHVKVA